MDLHNENIILINQFYFSLKKRTVYSDIKANKIEFEGSNQKYSANSLVHNKETTNLSFICKGQSDSKDYEITSLNFESKSSIETIIYYLNMVSSQKIRNIESTSEHFIKNGNDRHQLIMVEPLVNKISLRELFQNMEEYKFLKKGFQLIKLKFGIVTKIWETLCDLRSQSKLRDVGLGPWNVILVDSPSCQTEGLSNEGRVKLLFEKPCISISYKLGHFKKLLVADAKKDLTIKELADLGFFSWDFVQKLDKKFDALSDHFCFILILIEVITSGKHESCLKYVDFKNGVLTQEFKDRIFERQRDYSQNKILIDLIELCFKDKRKLKSTFFTESGNPIMDKLSKIGGGKFNNLGELKPSLFEIGVKLAPEQNHLDLILELNKTKISKSQRGLVARETITAELVRKVVQLVQVSDLSLNAKLELFDSMNLYLSIFMEGNSSSRKILNSRYTRQYFLWAAKILENFYQFCGDLQKKGFLRFYSLVIKKMSSTNLELFRRLTGENFGEGFVGRNISELESYAAHYSCL